MSIVTLSRDGLTAVIDSHGAQLTSLALDGCEYLWQADARWWNRHAPVLFPIVGSIRNNEATSAQGPIHLGRHGFARDCEYRLVSQTDDTVTFELEDTPETREEFPYAFKLSMTYALTGLATFAQTFHVENAGAVDLPFSVGGHPAFNVPIPGTEDTAFEDYELVFTKPWTFDSATVTTDGLWTYDIMNPILRDADRVTLARSLFDYDTVMLENTPDSTVTLRGKKSGRGVRVDFADFPYLGIWSAAGEAPFLAIEPWTGHATLTSEDDVFEHKRDITVLAPGEVDERSFTVTLL